MDGFIFLFPSHEIDIGNHFQNLIQFEIFFYLQFPEQPVKKFFAYDGIYNYLIDINEIITQDMNSLLSFYTQGSVFCLTIFCLEIKSRIKY